MSGGAAERAGLVVIGSGFAGSILARAVAAAWRRGGIERRVVLVERGTHPRFALGESSTPLAAIALERLAARYRLPDLAALAAYGRWSRAMPELPRGLKRGFSFFSHRAGERFDPGRDGRLLVAASPSDGVADAHWLRSALDARLVARAAAEGVVYRDRVELDCVEERDGGLRLSGRRGESRLEIDAGFVVDASGAGRFLERHLGAGGAGTEPEPDRPRPSRVASSLLYGHFGGAVPLVEAAGGAARLGPPGPYPDERAAVHHLIEEGWLYALPFDGRDERGRHLRVSLGVEQVPPAAPPADPEAALRSIVARYPTLAAQLAPAHAVEPVRFVPRVQHRLASGRVVGERFLLLPHAVGFSSPLFSTGIAWSLVAVERAARLLEAGPAVDREALLRYQRRLVAEVDWIDRLVAGAFRCFPALGSRFEAFAAWSLLYFAAASYTEASQRLLDRPPGAPWCDEPFLGAGDPVLAELLGAAEERLPGALAGGAPGVAAFRDWLLEALAPRDLCGFARPERGGLHPVDLEALVDAAHLLGLDAAAVRAALPRLRGDTIAG